MNYEKGTEVLERSLTQRVKNNFTGENLTVSSLKWENEITLALMIAKK